MKMMFLRWAGFAVLDLLVLALAFILAPVLPLFALGRSALPAWLAWFQTPDNPIDGDANFQTNVAPFPGAVTGWRQYVNRVLWLYRNPSYGFDRTVVSFLAAPAAVVRKFGPLPITGKPQTGWYFAIAANPDGTRAFQFYAVKLWGTGSASRCSFGWKLWMVPGVCQFAMTITPHLTVSE